MSGKWLQTNKKKKQLKSLEKKFKNSQKQSFTIALLIIRSENSKKMSPKTSQLL